MAVTWIAQEELLLEELEETYRGDVTKQLLKTWDTNWVYDGNVRQQLEEQFAFEYPYEADSKTKQKMSVSELKKREYLEEEEIEEVVVIPLLPRFMQKDTSLSGASRGTAYHRVLELLDFSKEYDTEALQEAISYMVEKELLTEEMAECVEASDLLKFLDSAIGCRVQSASKKGMFYAEQPFVMLDDFDGKTLVQGIIDVFFEEDGELVVLDYKTDRVSSLDELKERYQVQLDYYATALYKLTQKKVKEKVIYSFALQEEIEV